MDRYFLKNFFFVLVGCFLIWGSNLIWAKSVQTKTSDLVLFHVLITVFFSLGVNSILLAILKGGTMKKWWEGPFRNIMKIATLIYGILLLYSGKIDANLIISNK